MPPWRLRRPVRTLRRLFPEHEKARFASTTVISISSPQQRGSMWTHRVNQIYPLVSLAVDKFAPDVVLDVLSGSIRPLPVSSDLFRLHASSGVEIGEWGTRDGGREATDMSWDDAGESLHGWLLKVEVRRRERGLK